MIGKFRRERQAGRMDGGKTLRGEDEISCRRAWAAPKAIAVHSVYIPAKADFFEHVLIAKRDNLLLAKK